MSPDDEYTAYVSGRLPWLRRVAYLLCQDWHRADDLVQSAITRLYVKWRRARAADDLDAYVRVILVRVFLAEQRGGWFSRVRVTHAPPAGPAAHANHDLALDLRRALTAVPPRQRATLVLRYHCDLSVEQTAQVLGCSTGTVKSQTARGLAALRAELGPSYSQVPYPHPTHTEER
ncbi:SigE family RNA polymerase sigma factor [Nonomuraea roseoviolacea]|uniref:RNA polymerase sigma-70 factor (Sigma-E family) n=1 Tax=Nonomuraea roseoviolacea subsp. carminata TaxID=160689 RepID=A0ABT1K6H8_9ACTN|nr:SigE family RNA polymerase sigma factor [Nonomuraea roseoviolacea]MCP2349604.1 RNA polymerase sigma-70 factor (sigma-E family) [Nonomuraea roseoviolacea subsp. carminata]